LFVNQDGNVGIGTITPGTILDVAGAITSRPSGTGTGQTGQLIMRELVAGGTDTVAIRAPDAIGTSYALTLPGTAGSASQVLTTNGSGVLSWTTPSGGGALSGLTAATGTNTIANTNYAQAWNWDTLTTQTAMSMGTTSGTTGTLLNLTNSFNSATSTGNVLKVSTTGVSNAAVPLMLTNAGTGNSFRVNDDGLDTDTTPFVINAAGNVGIGVPSPTYKLQVDGQIYAWDNLVSGNGIVAVYPWSTTVYTPTSITSANPPGITASLNQTGDVAGSASTISLSTSRSGTGAGAYISAVAPATGVTPALTFSQQTGATAYNERMRIHENGNVGIGSTAPTTTLDIVGDVKAALTATNTSSFRNMTSIQGTLSPGSASTSDLRSLYSIAYSTSANVNSATIRGVLGEASYAGTANLGSAYGVSAEARNSSTGSIGTARAGDFSVVNSGGGTITNGYGVYTGTIAATNKWSVYANDATAPSYFAGNVGIGTTAPSWPLHVTRANTGMGITNSDFAAGTAGSGLYFQTTAATGNTTSRIQSFSTGSTAAANLFINPDGGNVGIGTTNPGGVLHTSGTAGNYMDRYGSGMHLLLRSTTGTVGAPAASVFGNIVGRVTFQGHNGTNFGSTTTSIAGVATETWTGTANGSRLDFYTTPNTTTAAANRMTIDQDGSVGIGITIPTHILHITGQGRSTNSAWATTSDIRLKDIHGQYDLGLDEILKINTVKFSYKKDNPLKLPSDKEFTGIIAQELQKVIPEAVEETKDGYLTVNSDPVHWAVINAIKDLFNKYILPILEKNKEQDRKLASLQKANEEKTKKLEAENATKEKEIQRLQDENKAIKKWICEKDPQSALCR
jgi:hypothetical protein